MDCPRHVEFILGKGVNGKLKPKPVSDVVLPERPPLTASLPTPPYPEEPRQDPAAVAVAALRPRETNTRAPAAAVTAPVKSRTITPQESGHASTNAVTSTDLGGNTGLRKHRTTIPMDGKVEMSDPEDRGKGKPRAE